MLKKLKIINYRSIENMDLYFEKTTNIIWNNGSGKTNILSAILMLFQNNIQWFWVDDILKFWSDHIFIQWEFIWKNKIHWVLSYSYDAKEEKKIFLLNGKKVTKKILFENILKTSYFSPMSMNLFYLWPKYRRDFLDSLLGSLFSDYNLLLKNYEKIVKSRNKVLKNIQEKQSEPKEIDFWNNSFIKEAKKIYEYRIQLNSFLETHIGKAQDIFKWKNITVSYQYITKTDLNNIEKSISEYLEKNFQRDIILGKTHIWPHIDDFDIYINNKSISHFASRWEIKSIIIQLKLLEIEYIKLHSGQSPLVLIDDLSSELDEIHIDLILKKLKGLQIIFTSIFAIDWEKEHIIKI